MKNMLIGFMLLTHLAPVFSLERVPLLLGQDRQNQSDRVIPEGFLPRINSQEIRLAQSYVSNEMQWVEHFYQQAFEDPQEVKTSQEKARARLRGMTALVDYIRSAIQTDRSQSRSVFCGEFLNCVPPIKAERGWEENSQNAPSNLIIVGTFFIMGAAGFAIYQTFTLPEKMDLLSNPKWQCNEIGKGAFFDHFINDCMHNSYQNGQPFNTTQLMQDNNQVPLSTMLWSLCSDLAGKECTKWAIDYNQHEYPKKYLKSLVPTMIVVPVVVLACVGAQILACKYRRWRYQTGSLYADALEAEEHIKQELNKIDQLGNSPRPADVKIEKLV